MNYRLVYDAVTTSDAPKVAMAYGIVALLLVLLWGAWLRYRGKALHAGVKFLGVITLIMLTLSAGYRLEQRVISKRTPKLVEGPIAGYWENRQRRAGNDRSYWQWEGFSVSGVNFAYVTNAEQNYFHNGGTPRLQIEDGLLVRVHYLEERDGNQTRNQIVRLEAGAL